MTKTTANTKCTGGSGMMLACLLLMSLAAAPLCAQSYQDLYNFDCSSGGCIPEGALMQGTDGNLYGTTSSGGLNGVGTIFKVSTTGSGYTVLWNFDTSTGAPTGGLTRSSIDGNLYGTTVSTLYRFIVSSQSLTSLHVFSSSEGVPAGPPVENTTYKLFGVTGPGQAYVWQVPTNAYTLLKGKIPKTPSGPLFLASDQNLYGASFSGGSNDAGAVFRITSNGKSGVVYSFTGLEDGTAPNAPLVEGKDGQLYGTASGGGFFNDGTIFSLTLPNPSSFETTQYEFNNTNSQAYEPEAGLLAASDGNFYGSTNLGGVDNLGTIFQFQPGGSFIQYVDLSGTTGINLGAFPETNMIEDTNGTFYGVTSAGGTHGSGMGDGVLFSFTPPHPSNHIALCCNWWVILDQPVTILGSGLRGAINVTFGGVAARFRLGSDTYLTALVPSGAIDGPVAVTLATGLQIQSEQNAHVLPKITNLDPPSGSVGTLVDIVGGGFAGTTKVTFGSVTATNFTIVSPSLIQATVPAGAVTGKVGITTPNGSAKSKQTFTVR